ncbi:GDP-L-fucose synthase [Coraliomargarita sp. SDUM461004]|uniref:GDP-L-fucose synthase n=1 Tax=Thalassobacterium sedimentorum TaxID=3041258 RepID=A0ABU1AH96_9BACT|nr:GDP-L-fucose synthase [Coraliomargarita sp. SDUM461004]MDQ8193563.1 GDP-L-fucose synthase [Coraliomargarita sp. SDUM461004]
MDKQDTIYVAGHRGMVGGAVVRALQSEGYDSILTRTRSELDLLDQSAVHAFFQAERPTVAVIAAARVGGIHANNTYPAEFMYENLSIAQNTIHAAYQAGVKRLLFLGSTCIYPKLAEQPIREASLLTAPLEPTNEAYAIAKIAGLKMCEFYRRQYGVCYHSAMPTNLYGPGDNYHPQNSHVLPALIRRFHEAKQNAAPEVAIWGTGTPLREFLHADDAAAGILHLLQLENPPNWVNLGCGEDISIGDLARLVMQTVGYQGELTFDTSKPDGTPRKLTDISCIKETGWSPKIDIEQGVAMAYQSFLEEQAAGALRQ